MLAEPQYPVAVAVQRRLNRILRVPVLLRNRLGVLLGQAELLDLLQEGVLVDVELGRVLDHEENSGDGSLEVAHVAHGAACQLQHLVVVDGAVHHEADDLPHQDLQPHRRLQQKKATKPKAKQMRCENEKYRLHANRMKAHHSGDGGDLRQQPVRRIQVSAEPEPLFHRSKAAQTEQLGLRSSERASEQRCDG